MTSRIAYARCPGDRSRPPTAGSAPSDPKRGKGAELDDGATAGISVVGVSTAVADTGSPSDEGAGRSGTSAAKLFLMSICPEPLADTPVRLAACHCFRFPRLVM